jgi:hypothetical protein
MQSIAMSRGRAPATRAGHRGRRFFDHGTAARSARSSRRARARHHLTVIPARRPAQPRSPPPRAAHGAGTRRVLHDPIYPAAVLPLERAIRATSGT